MHRGAWLVCVLLAALLVARAQPPAPTPVDPLALTGGLISETTSMSCDDIFAGDPDSDGTTESLNCNKASVLMLQVPLKETDENGVTFDFAPNGQSGGGAYHTPPNQCEKGPGYCLYGQAFRINIRVSVVATAFDLTFMHIVSPFAYSYENCLSLAPATNTTFYPYYAEGTCGPADIWDWNDYRTCTDKRAWPFFYHQNEPDQADYATGYSDCAFMCGWQLEKQAQLLASTTGQSLEAWCNDPSRVHRVDTDDYQTDAVTPLACDKATAWKDDVRTLLPRFPQPTGFCPCAGSATVVNPSPTPPPPGMSAPPTGPFSSIVGCKSCAGAGTCGSALPRPEPTDPEAQCKDTDNEIDTVCDCVPGDGNSVGGFDPSNDPVNDPDTVCFNTGQRHRCLKCQPVLTTDPNAGNQNALPETCAYTDLNQYAFCNTYWMDVCGNGDYTLSDRQRQNSATDSSITMCNCKGVFIERAYWVAPFCAPYRIVNPGKLQYVINVTLLYGGDPNSPLYNTPVPNGTMTVGAGFSPFVDPGDPPNAAAAVLSWLNATVDGFAVTEIESEYTKAGGYTTNLPGAIVMCDNGQGPEYCGFTTTNDTDNGAVPNADIRTAGRTGLNNPWPDVAGTGPPIVPLPDFIYNTSAAGNYTANRGQWWYYLTQEELDTYGIGCGQNGWRSVGPADTASSYTMCNNLQGTCVPGIDRQFRGEAIKPPCSVATDFLNYVADPANSPDTDTGKAVNPPDPGHVPPGWNNQNPQYAVHRGKLFWYNDPVVTGGEAAVRLRISVAADFQQETVVQAGGTVAVTDPPDCTVSTQDLLGSFYVLATNKGTMAAEYQFTKGECTAGLDFAPQVVSIKPSAPATPGGPPVPTRIRLAVSGSALYGTAEQPAGAQSCSVVMTPSLAPGLVLGTTAVIPCTPVYGLPDIAPILSANTSYEEGLADTYIINYVNSGTCSGWFCDIWNPKFHNQFLSPLEWAIVSFFLTVFIFVLTILMIVCVGQKVARMEAQQTAYRNTVLQQARRFEARAAVS